MAEDTNKKDTTLMDADNEQAMKEFQEHAKKVARVAKEIEAILIKEKMTWGDWGEVVELFSTRIGKHVASITITKL